MSSRFGPTWPFVPASASVWQPPQFDVKTCLPAAEALAEPPAAVLVELELLLLSPPPPHPASRSARIVRPAQRVRMRGTIPRPLVATSHQAGAPFAIHWESNAARSCWGAAAAGTSQESRRRAPVGAQLGSPDPSHSRDLRSLARADTSRTPPTHRRPLRHDRSA